MNFYITDRTFLSLLTWLSGLSRTPVLHTSKGKPWTIRSLRKITRWFLLALSISIIGKDRLRLTRIGNKEMTLIWLQKSFMTPRRCSQFFFRLKISSICSKNMKSNYCSESSYVPSKHFTTLPSHWKNWFNGYCSFPLPLNRKSLTFSLLNIHHHHRRHR